MKRMYEKFMKLKKRKQKSKDYDDIERTSQLPGRGFN